MELTISSLSLSTTTTPIPDYAKGPDPHLAFQIHDYLRVSFLRQPSEVKAASQKAIQIFTAHYPETLNVKYFVNVPLVMQWMSYGEELYKYLGEGVGKAYGGKGPELEDNSVTPLYEQQGPGDAVADAAAAKEMAI